MFLVLCGLVVIVLYKQIGFAFMANPGLNGLIIGVLLVGIILAFLAAGVAFIRRDNLHPFLPPNPETFAVLLRSFTLDKALYELLYELNNRPDWVCIPLHGIHSLIEQAQPIAVNCRLPAAIEAAPTES